MKTLAKVSCYTVCFFVSFLIFILGGIVSSYILTFVLSLDTVDKSLPEHLLAKKYNEVAYATTHNSYAIFGIIAAANHFKPIKTSLENGVRALMLDVHFSDNTKSTIELCHGDCAAGGVEILSVFNTIADFLEKYPMNVITIIWETTCDVDSCNIQKNMLYSIVENSRLSNMLYTPNFAHRPWPTLREMVNDNRGSVVQFSDRPPFNRTWDLNIWDYVIETPYEQIDGNDLDVNCTFNRGMPDSTEKLFLNNHFTYIGLSPFHTLTTGYNTNPYMYNRIIRCQHELGKNITNFVAVDHWYYSDVVNTVACLNTQKSEMCQKQNTLRFVAEILISITGGMCCICSIYACVSMCINSDLKPMASHDSDEPTEEQPLIQFNRDVSKSLENP
jgi:hypothetical protein